MDYNTDRKGLMLPEYGRIVQDMVDYALTLDKKADRQRCANAIVRTMFHFQPQMAEMPDGKRVLWDHLAKMSHYKLDIDYPVEITREEEIDRKPEGMPLPMTDIRLRHYGHLLETLIARLDEMEDGRRKGKLTELTLNQMRKNLLYYTGDAADEEKIINDLTLYTKGRIQVKPGTYTLTKNIPETGISNGTNTGNRRKRKK